MILDIRDEPWCLFYFFRKKAKNGKKIITLIDLINGKEYNNSVLLRLEKSAIICVI